MGNMWRFFLFAFLTFAGTAVSQEYSIDLTVDGKNGEPGGKSFIRCHSKPNNTILWWQKGDRNMTADTRFRFNRTENADSATLTLTILKTRPSDSAWYSCQAAHAENIEIVESRKIFLNVTLDGRVVERKDARANDGSNTALRCLLQGYPLQHVSWRIGKSGLSELLPQNMDTKQLNESHVETFLQFHRVNHFDNGTYVCQALGPSGPFNATAHLYVLDKPNVTIGLVKAVGARTLYVNWTATDGNEPIKMFFIQTRKNGTDQWVHYPHEVGGGNSSFLIKNLEPEVAYQVSVTAKNKVGPSDQAIHKEWVTTLSQDPQFVPEVTVKGTTSDSVSIGWTQPRPDVRDYIHYYQIILENNETRQETVYSAASMNLYMFMKLKPMTTYRIKIAACSEYTRICGPWSREVNGTTLEGIPDPPENLTVFCLFDNISHYSRVNASWSPPQRAFGKISQYKVVLQGMANFLNESGHLDLDTYGPEAKMVEGNKNSTQFEHIRPNTNYTVRVSVMTKQRHIGREAIQNCSMPPTIPDREKLQRFAWTKVESDSRWLLQLNLQRASERNGEIMCYAIYLVRLRNGQRAADLPPPEEMPVSSYAAVHKPGAGGAYLADAVDKSSWTSDLFLGDENVVLSVESRCLEIVARLHYTPTTNPPLAEINGLSVPPLDEDYPTTTNFPSNLTLAEGNERTGRSADVENAVVDGPLDPGSNYTGFVELIVTGKNGSILPAYSGYLPWVKPGPVALGDSPLSVAPELTVALHVLIALVVIVCILLVVLFFLHNYTKTVAEEQGLDMNLTNTLMHLCRNVGGRHVPVASSPPDLPPIAKTDLPAAVAERHRDSDYGFQSEFELLPDRFPDRTTRASEARENVYKNRYPDIKAYDQTRVRLIAHENTPGSDYINANYVIGYKERKKFVCAQGPMDTTVNDFWRLVWEQHLEMILMLTNLEEYSKTKCAQYWPDAGAGSRRFGDITVSHVHEVKYADYLVRQLSLRHGDIESGETGEDRRVVQYHYLTWKDFMAPDNPQGILKFIRRVNEQYSLEKGPILVHCSAGVGRTGTLVALDSLLQQLREENQVAIFNTVCDLRHQRNFLVQSLKQYIFIYRALLEVSQTGDTEIKLSNLKSTIERMRARENGKDRCLLEDEFDRLRLLVDDRIKSSAVGGAEENKAKNRNPELLPLDRNRVMLSPIPGKDHSTYINASFVEGYDSPDAMVVTQDPLPLTLPDFWRMICEHCIHTIVMLSDLGDGPRKCIRYWPEPDDEATYENIKVRYIQSESCPYYTRREFSVTNLKNNETLTTVQFQYNGWPTVEGVLPEVTRGMIELVDQTTESHSTSCKAPGASPGPLLVHCNWGAERSSVFTALYILIAQLKAERAVDVFGVARKLRAQRPLMLDAFAQYDFVHRAILNYAELHHMMENGVTPTSPL